MYEWWYVIRTSEFITHESYITLYIVKDKQFLYPGIDKNCVVPYAVVPIIAAVINFEIKVILLILMWSTDYMTSGPRLNIKTVLSTYGDFHVKDKTAVRTSYL